MTFRIVIYRSAYTVCHHRAIEDTFETPLKEEQPSNILSSARKATGINIVLYFDLPVVV